MPELPTLAIKPLLIASVIVYMRRAISFIGFASPAKCKREGSGPIFERREAWAWTAATGRWVGMSANSAR